MTEESKTEKQYGVKLPNGFISWDPVWTPNSLTPNYSDRVVRAERLKKNDEEVRRVGIKPSKATRIQFLVRDVTTSYGETEEVSDDE